MGHVPPQWIFIQPLSRVGVGDRFWLFIFTLNRAKKWFNSIFNSKLNQEYSFNKIIHSNWKKIKAWENSEKLWKKHAKWGVFYSKRTFYSFFLWISHFFDSFKNSFNSTAKIFIQKKYSFKKISDHSLKKSHSKKYLIIHSIKHSFF